MLRAWICSLACIGAASCSQTLPIAADGPLLTVTIERLWIMGNSPGRKARFTWDGQLLALWDVASGRREAVLRHEQAIVGLDYRPDGRMIATSGDDSAVRLWSHDGVPQRTIIADNHVYKVAFSGDGRWLASAGRARSAAGTTLYQLTGLGGGARPVKLWRVSDGALIAALPHPTDVMGIAFSPDGRHLVSSDDDGRARLWRVSPVLR